MRFMQGVLLVLVAHNAGVPCAMHLQQQCYQQLSCEQHMWQLLA
jgi:hypothetical protein